MPPRSVFDSQNAGNNFASPSAQDTPRKGHRMHDVAPRVFTNFPPTHGAQTLVAMPPATRPGSHGSHRTMPLLDLSPGGQSKHCVAFKWPLANRPERHWLQVPVPLAVVTWPFSHASQPTLPALERKPAGQSKHSVAAALAYWPATHSLQLLELVSVATFPLSHGSQASMPAVE